MRKILLLLLMFSIALLHAQTGTQKKTFSVSVDEHTIIKDSLGNRIPYNVAVKYLAMGTYTLDPVKDANGNYTEFKLRAKNTGDGDKRGTTMVTPGTENYPKPQVGMVFPDFTLFDMDSTPVKLSDYKGKVIVLNFWFSVCRPCMNEIPGLNSLVKQYASNKNVVFIAPDWEKKTMIEKFLSFQNFDYRICPLSTDIINTLKIRTYPTHVVIGKDGKIYSSYSGGLPGIEDVLKKDIDAALIGAAPKM